MSLFRALSAASVIANELSSGGFRGKLIEYLRLCLPSTKPWLLFSWSSGLDERFIALLDHSGPLFVFL